MTYSDFTLEMVERAFGVTVQPAALFPALAPLPVPLWLQELLAKGRQLALISEKARSEFIVAPLLLACREISQGAVAIDSGMRLDVLPEQGLAGECDFVQTATPPVPVLIKRAVNLAKGSAEPNKVKVGKITEKQVEEIAKIKLPDMNTTDIEAAMQTIKGTARTMGIDVEEK